MNASRIGLTCGPGCSICTDDPPSCLKNPEVLPAYGAERSTGERGGGIVLEKLAGSALYHGRVRQCN